MTIFLASEQEFDGLPVVGKFVRKKQVIRDDSLTFLNANESKHVLKVALNHETLIG